MEVYIPESTDWGLWEAREVQEWRRQFGDQAWDVEMDESEQH